MLHGSLFARWVEDPVFYSFDKDSCNDRMKIWLYLLAKHNAVIAFYLAATQLMHTSICMLVRTSKFFVTWLYDCPKEHSAS